jgi:zinc protease
MTKDLTPIPSLPPGVKLTTLDNGLVIIVREDQSAPVVSAQAWCAAGSIHEGKWLGAGHQAQREFVKSWPPTWPVQPATLTPKLVP